MKKRTFIIVSLLFVVLLALTSCVPGGEPYRGEDGLFGGGDSFSKSISPETREGMEGLELAANILLGFITSKSVSFVVLFVLFWILLYGIFNTALSKALKVDKLTKMHKMISFSLGGVIMFSLFFVVKNPFARMVSIAGSMNMLFAIFISIIVFLCMKYMWNREGDQEGGRGNFSSLLAAFVALMLFSGLARGVTGISGLAATMQIIVGVILVLVVAGGLLGHIGERVAPGSRLGGPTSDRTWLGDPRGPAAGREPGEGISPRHAAALREFDQRMNDLSRQIDQVIRDVGAERAHIRQLRELHERKEDMVERIHQLYGGRVRAAIQSQQLMQGSGRGGSRLNPRNWFRRRGLPDLIDAQQEIINQLDEFIRDLGAHLEDLHRMFGLTHINFARIEGELRRVVEGLTHPSTQFRLRSGQRLNFEQILRRLADLLNDEREFLTTRVEWTIPNDYVDIHNYQEQEELIAVLEQVFGREMRDAFAVVVKAVEMERIAGTIIGLLTQGYTELAAGNMPQARTACDNARTIFNNMVTEAANPPPINLDDIGAAITAEIAAEIGGAAGDEHPASQLWVIIDDLDGKIGGGPPPIPPPGVWPDPHDVEIMIDQADDLINPPGGGAPDFIQGARISLDAVRDCDDAVAMAGIPPAVAAQFTALRPHAVNLFNEAVDHEITRIDTEPDNIVAEPWFRSLEPVWANANAMEAAGAPAIIDHGTLDGPYSALEFRFP